MIFLFSNEILDLEKFERFNNFDQEAFKNYKENKTNANDYELHYFEFLENQYRF